MSFYTFSHMQVSTQLSFSVNANSESLRSYFVTHEGQKTLILEYGENVTRHSLDYKIVARDFSNLLRKEASVVAPLRARTSNLRNR